MTRLPLKPFILRPENSGESICTACYLTVRATKEFPTLKEAEEHHDCRGVDLKAMRDQR